MFLINLNDFISNLKSTKYIENMIKIFEVHHPGIELRTFRSSVRRSTN